MVGLAVEDSEMTPNENYAIFALTGTVTPDALLPVAVPAGTSHDELTGGAFAPGLCRPRANTDFEIEVKFDSAAIREYSPGFTGLIDHRFPG